MKQDIAASLHMDSYPGPLGQAVSNLISNVLVHDFEGRSADTILITAKAGAEGWIELSVSDDGAGISADHMKRIYDSFFTTRLGAGSSGLGLYIAHNIVTCILGGRISAASEVGSGTTFVLSLPMSAPLGGDTADAATRATAPV